MLTLSPPGAGPVAAANQEKPGVVRGIVFDAGRQHLAAIGEGCPLAGDGGGLAVALLDHMLDAAGGVVEGSGRHFCMLAQKSAALGKGDGMGEDPADAFYRAAWGANEIVADAQQRLALYLYLALKEKVEVLDDGTCQRIFNRDDRCADFSAFDQLENLGRVGAGNNGCLRFQIQGSFVTKGSELSLNGDPHLCPEDLILMIRQPTRTQTHQSTAWQDFCKEKYTMLWTIFLVLLVLWLVGFIGFHVVAWYIHILLIIALVVLVIQLVGGRRAI